MGRHVAAAVLLILVCVTATLSSTAHAAAMCALPRDLSRPDPVVPRSGDVRRNTPVTGYVLALSWSPQFCARRTDGRSAFQCDSSNRFGFILHGLWPEGRSGWPQYCRPAPLVSRDEIIRNLCFTPSTQLIQHEWAKHGTCMASRPEEYFAVARRLYTSFQLPDMQKLARRRDLTIGGLVTAFVEQNRHISSDALTVETSRDGWLGELKICLDRDFAPTRCRGGRVGKKLSAPLRIRL